MKNKKLKPLSLIIILVLLLTACASPAPAHPAQTFQVHFIDVGQADSALVICDGQAMLIDGGNVGDSSLLYSYLEQEGLSQLDYTVCTHAHEDHVGGLAGALNYANTNVAYCPVTSYDSRAFEDFVKALEKQGKKITVPTIGESFMLGSARVEFLATDTAFEDPNNNSSVLRVTYKDVSFLFTGDIERERGLDLIDAGLDLSCTVLKVAHHGSDSSSSYQFLYEAQPQYAVISCGRDNSYGHPHEEVLSRLKDAETTLFRTDLNGTIVFEYEDGGLSITCEKLP